MFSYAKDVSLMAQDIIKNYCGNFNTAVDCTLGNGHDTEFLSKYFNKVYSFDIQEIAIRNFEKNKPTNVVLIHDSHEEIEKYIENEHIDCFMYNLGFLPGGNKEITTKANSSLNSIKSSLKKLSNNGIITICLYIGHEEGKKEAESLLPFLKFLDKSKYAVVVHKVINRNSISPSLIVIEKK